jgi:hypothetical protein
MLRQHRNQKLGAALNIKFIRQSLRNSWV